MWPVVNVLIPTYNRAAVVRRTVDQLREKLRYGGGLRFVIGCDGTDDTPARFTGEPEALVLDQPSGSLGANLNRLWAAADSDITLSLDDDHWLMNPIDLQPHVEKLQSDPSAGWIHLLVDAVGDEANDGYKFIGRLEGKYWRLQYDSPDEWPCSFRAHLAHRRFHTAAGPFPEGKKSGQTEWEYNQRVKQMGIAGKLPSVLVPLCAYGFAYWAHVGQSWNRRGL